mmetsp:Transcript_37516/g.83502  ORF Transcript_37516/g.83502 Transcript_37516/m.83502 type:complete len:110 (-) Transcript_37516:1289-1618(-)
MALSPRAATKRPHGSHDNLQLACHAAHGAGKHAARLDNIQHACRQGFSPEPCLRPQCYIITHMPCAQEAGNPWHALLALPSPVDVRAALGRLHGDPAGHSSVGPLSWAS